MAGQSSYTEQRNNIRYTWQNLFNRVLISTIYLLGTTTKKFGNSDTGITGLPSAAASAEVGFRLGSATGGTRSAKTEGNPCEDRSPWTSARAEGTGGIAASSVRSSSERWSDDASGPN